MSWLFSSDRPFSSSSIVLYLSSAALARSPCRSATWASDLAESIFSFISRIRVIISFSFCQWLVISSACPLRPFNSSSIFFNRCLDGLSDSFLSASLSISSWVVFLLRSSISDGRLSISILSLLVASSTRSIALSGRKRSVIYLLESTAAETSAESLILTPWCISYFSLRPLKMEMVSSTVGSATTIGWKRLSRAASFSIYFLYSLIVVAPTHLSSPRARAGLSMLDASIAPSAAPAPTRV